MAEIMIEDSTIGAMIDKYNTDGIDNLNEFKGKVIDLYKKITDTSSKISEVNEKLVELCLNVIKRENDDKNRVIETKKGFSAQTIQPTQNVVVQNVTRQDNILPKKSGLANRVADLGINAVKSTAKKATGAVDDFLDREIPFYGLMKSTVGVTGKLLGGLFSRNKTTEKEPIAEKIGITNKLGDFNVLGTTKNEDVGISKKPLNENTVLKYSAIGVATAWLVKKLGGGLSGGDDGGLMSTVMDLFKMKVGSDILLGTGGGLLGLLKNVIFHPFRTLGSLIGGITGIITRAITVMGVATAAITMYSDFVNRKSAEELTGKSAEDVTGFDRVTSAAFQTLLGNVGTGTAEERRENSNQQALKYAGAGAAIGNMFFGTKGAAVGGLAGAGFGKIVGYIGGDTIAKGVIGAKDKLTGNTTIAPNINNTKMNNRKPEEQIDDKKMKEEIESAIPNTVKDAPNMIKDTGKNLKIAMDDTTSAQEKLAKANEEKVEQTKNSMKKMSSFDEEVKKTIESWKAFWGLTPNTPTVPETSQSAASTPSNGKIVNLDANASTIENAKKLIVSQEGGGVGTVNRNDAGSFSIGSLQYNWNSGNALKYLNHLNENDKEGLIKKYMGENFIEKLNSLKGKRGITLSKNEQKQWQEMIKYDKANGGYLTKADDEFTTRYVARYLDNAQKLGIQDERLKILYANMQNQYGETGAKRLFNAAGYQQGQTLDYDSFTSKLHDAIYNAKTDDGRFKFRKDHFIGRFDRSVEAVRNMPSATSAQPSETISDLHAKEQTKEAETVKATQAGIKEAATTITDVKRTQQTPQKDIELSSYSNASDSMEDIKNKILKFFFGGIIGGEFNELWGY